MDCAIAMTTISDVSSGAARAAAFLSASRGGDGLWRDFRTLAGASSEWVTGFVAHSLSVHDSEDPAFHYAIDALIARQRRSGGWGYSAEVPADCDTTAWVLLAIGSATWRRPSVYHRALEFVCAHRRRGGGFSTYQEKSGIGAFIGSHLILPGWMEEHVCVSGVATQTLLCAYGLGDRHLKPSLEFLAATQGAEGVWSSYWWTGHSYATYHAMKALRFGNRLDGADRVARAWFVENQRSGGGWAAHGGAEEPFETAFATLALMFAPLPDVLPAAKRGVAWLLANQLDDGSWASKPMLRIPPPRVKTPSPSDPWRLDGLGGGALLADGGRTFTTAAGLWALAIARDLLQET
jgi:sporulenol synthase